MFGKNSLVHWQGLKNLYVCNILTMQTIAKTPETVAEPF